MSQFDIVKRIGAGGMAEVFLVSMAQGPLAGRQFALKRLLPQLLGDDKAVQGFLQEGSLLVYLRHPNVVSVYEMIDYQGTPAMVMEYVEGCDVAQLLRRCRAKRIQWPVDFALYLTATLLDALHCAHTLVDPAGSPLEVIHGDVSPGNFFVSRTGDLKLGDFGVARRRGLVQQNEIFGKLAYLSPEALEGSINEQMDLWAAAVVLYELLTLQKPFQGKDEAMCTQAIRERRYVRCSDLRAQLPAGIDAVFETAFSKSVDSRFADAAAFRDALRGLYDVNVGTPLAVASMVRGLTAP